MATSDLSELDQLIHSFEFENHQLVKMIEKEYQMIDKLESGNEEKNNESERLEEHIKEMELDINRLEEQNNTNRNLIKNLKSTRSVMVDHEQALSKQLQSLKLETETKRKFYEEHIAKYTAIHEDYMKKYKSFPLAIELEETKIRLEKKKNFVAEKKARLAYLKQQEEDLKKQAHLRNWKDLIVRMAKSKVSTMKMEKEIELKSLAAEQKAQQVEEMASLAKIKEEEETSAAMEVDEEGESMSVEDVQHPEKNVRIEENQDRLELYEYEEKDKPSLPQDSEAAGMMSSGPGVEPIVSSSVSLKDMGYLKHSNTPEDTQSHRQTLCEKETAQKVPSTRTLPPPTPRPRCVSAGMSASPAPPKVTPNVQLGGRVQPTLNQRVKNAVCTLSGPTNIQTLRGTCKSQATIPAVTTTTQANSRLRIPVFGKSLGGVNGNRRPESTAFRSTPLSLTAFGPPRLPGVKAPIRPPRPFAPTDRTFVPQTPVKNTSAFSRLSRPSINVPTQRYDPGPVLSKSAEKLAVIKNMTSTHSVLNAPDKVKSSVSAPKLMTPAGDAGLTNHREKVEKHGQAKAQPHSNGLAKAQPHPNGQVKAQSHSNGQVKAQSHSNGQAKAHPPSHNKLTNIQDKMRAEPDPKAQMTPGPKFELKTKNMAEDAGKIIKKKDSGKTPNSAPSTQPFALHSSFENLEESCSGAGTQTSGGFSLFGFSKKGSQSASDGYEGDEDLCSGKSLFSFDRFNPVDSPGSDTSQTKDIFSMFNKSPENENHINPFAFTFQPTETTDDEGGNFLNFGAGSPNDNKTSGGFLNFGMVGDSEEENAGNKPAFLF